MEFFSINPNPTRVISIKRTVASYASADPTHVATATAATTAHFATPSIVVVVVVVVVSSAPVFSESSSIIARVRINAFFLVVVVVVNLRCAPVDFVVANDERAVVVVVFIVAFDIVVCRTYVRYVVSRIVVSHSSRCRWHWEIRSMFLISLNPDFKNAY